MPTPNTPIAIVSNHPEHVPHLLEVLPVPFQIYPVSSAGIELSIRHPFYFIHLPRLAHSLELLTAIKSQAPTSFVSVILTQPDVEEVLQIVQAGADCCLRNTDLLPQKILANLQQWQADQNRHRWWNRIRLLWRRGPSFITFKPTLVTTTLTPEHTSPRLYVHFFGTLSLTDERGATMSPGEGRIAALLACLLYYGHEGVHRDKLIYYFWPDVARDSAYNSLHVAIHQLRQLLRHHLGSGSIIERNTERYCVNTNLRIGSDLEDFEEHLQRGQLLLQSGQQAQAIRAYEQAHQLYQDDFLAEFRYHDWTIPIRDTLWEKHLSLLETLLELSLEATDYARAITIGQFIHQLDSCLEKVHRQIMYAHYRLGQRGKALRQYGKCVKILGKELQARPSQETEELYRIILQQSKMPIAFPLI